MACDLEQLARTIAAKHGLDGAIVCALCEQESGFDLWACRYEQGFYDGYIVEMLTNGFNPAIPPGVSKQTEARARATSFGLMQVLGQVARERGFKGVFLTELCDPTIGLEYGCIHFAAILKSKAGDLKAALLRYNGGGRVEYAEEVLQRVGKYGF